MAQPSTSFLQSRRGVKKDERRLLSRKLVVGFHVVVGDDVCATHSSRFRSHRRSSSKVPAEEIPSGHDGTPISRRVVRFSCGQF